MNKLFCIIGESATGKDTIVKLLIEIIKKENINVKLLQSNTTRPIRDCEMEGREYNFVNNKEFYRSYKDDNILEYATYNTVHGIWHYFTLKSDLKLDESNYIKIINPLGLSIIRQQIPQEQLVVFYITCNENVRKQRSINRGDSQDEVVGRLERDKKDFRHVAYDFKINNDGSDTLDNIANQIYKNIKERLC